MTKSYIRRPARIAKGRPAESRAAARTAGAGRGYPDGTATVPASPALSYRLDALGVGLGAPAVALALGLRDLDGTAHPGYGADPLATGTRVGGGLCVTYGDDRYAEARDLAVTSAVAARWASGDGAFYAVFRPLLPDEAGCAPLDR